MAVQNQDEWKEKNEAYRREARSKSRRKKGSDSDVRKKAAYLYDQVCGHMSKFDELIPAWQDLIVRYYKLTRREDGDTDTHG